MEIYISQILCLSHFKPICQSVHVQYFIWKIAKTFCIFPSLCVVCGFFHFSVNFFFLSFFLCILRFAQPFLLLFFFFFSGAFKCFCITLLFCIISSYFEVLLCNRRLLYFVSQTPVRNIIFLSQLNNKYFIFYILLVCFSFIMFFAIYDLIRHKRCVLV